MLQTYGIKTFIEMESYCGNTGREAGFILSRSIVHHMETDNHYAHLHTYSAMTCSLPDFLVSYIFVTHNQFSKETYHFPLFSLTMTNCHLKYSQSFT